MYYSYLKHINSLHTEKKLETALQSDIEFISIHWKIPNFNAQTFTI